MNRLSIALGVACATLAIGAAQAAVDPSAASVAAKVGACGKLPLSERGICKQQALAAAPATRQATGPAAMTDAQRAALKTENERYRARLAACSRMPLSEQTTCVSNAGIDAKLKAAS